MSLRTLISGSRRTVFILSYAAALCFAPFAAAEPDRDAVDGAKDPAGADLQIIAVVGTGGLDEYEAAFSETAAIWEQAARESGTAFRRVGPVREGGGAAETDPEAEDGREEGETDRDALQRTIAEASAPELWIVLIGHGTYDGREVKFNLQGPDFTDTELAQWLEDFPGDLAVVNTASASGSFIRKLSGPGRVIITATKNEAELSYTRFGRFFAEAIAGKAEADLDHDEQVSLLESFLYAADQVAKFYETEGRLATEHPLLDDNGDSFGSRAEWFEGTTATRAPSHDAEPDGDLARLKVLVKNEFEQRLTGAQRARRDELEQAVRQLRRQRDDLGEDEYYGKLETLLLELAAIYRDVDET